MSLSGEMTRLADLFRKKYSVNDKLGITDMINLLSQKNIILIPTSSFTIPNGYPVQGTKLIKLGSTINGGRSSWGSITGLSVPNNKALTYANNDKFVVNLYLYITNVETGGIAWLKWNDTDNKTEFTPTVGDNLIQVPSALGEEQFNLVIHPFFDSITIDPTKSYIEAFPSA